MRIAEVSTDVLPSPPTKGGAIERFVYQLSKAMAQLGEEVHLISINSSYSVTRNGNLCKHTYPKETSSIPEKLLGALIFKLSSPSNRKLLYTTRAVTTILMRIEEMFGNIDVIHNHFFTTAFAPIIFKLSKHDVLLAQHYHNIPTPKIVNKLVAKCYDIHFAVSNYVRSEVIRLLGIPQNKVFTVHNGIDVDEFTCDNGYREKMREMYGIKTHETVILYIGRIIPEKGLHHLIEAYALTRKKLNDHKLRLVIAGPIGHFSGASSRDLTYYRHVEKIIENLGLRDEIMYVGHINNKAATYSVSDIVVVPSIWQEPFGLVAVEGLASCRPVVAYFVGGLPEIFQGLPYDFLVKPVTPKALSDKIVEVIKALDRIDNRSLRRHIENRFSIHVVAKQVRELLRMISR